MLYFASQKRLVRYGSAMITDFYAFQYGPVSSNYLIISRMITISFGLPFRALADKSHDSAWKKAWESPTGKRGAKISLIDIAIAAGADEKAIEYIQEELELESVLR